VRFSYGAVEEGWKLANKLWNVSRLLLGAEGEEVAARPASVEERWILARIDGTRQEVEDALAAFRFFVAANALYHLVFDDFCDWYAEAIKPRLYERDADTVATALFALERVLTLLHPLMPHVTEEIWTELPARRRRLIVSSWPEPEPSYAADLAGLDRVQDAAAIYRRSGVVAFLEGDERRIFEAVVRPRASADGAANREAEVARLRREIARAEGMLGNERFVTNAPTEVVEGEREKLARYRRELEALGG
jgi:valyl-tRNA synthetase